MLQRSCRIQFSFYVFFRNQGRMNEAVQVLSKAVNKVQTGYLRLAKLTHFLVRRTNSTTAKRALYHFIKLGCKIAEHQPAMEDCSEALVPVLQDYVNVIKKEGTTLPRRVDYLAVGCL